MEQILQNDKSMAFISMVEYLELLKMKEELINNEKIISYEIEKDKYHTKTIKFAYITKDDVISEISKINNNLNDEISNLHNIIKTNNEKYNNIESSNRDLNAKLYFYEGNLKDKNEDIKNLNIECDTYKEKLKDLASLKDMNTLELLEWKYNTKYKKIWKK